MNAARQGGYHDAASRVPIETRAFIGGRFTDTVAGGSFAEAFSDSPVITGSGWSASSASWSYAFDNGSGDLTISAIPEPSAFAALAGLVGLGLVGCRRRRR